MPLHKILVFSMKSKKEQGKKSEVVKKQQSIPLVKTLKFKIEILLWAVAEAVASREVPV